MIYHNILSSIIALSALATGMAAPQFEAISHDGRKIKLSELLQNGPVVLVLLRGFG
jgi:peroxiredoxin